MPAHPTRRRGRRPSASCPTGLGRAENDLEDAQDALDREADSLEESIQRTASSAESLANVLVTGRQTIVDVAASDPQLAAALAARARVNSCRRTPGDEHV